MPNACQRATGRPERAFANLAEAGMRPPIVLPATSPPMRRAEPTDPTRAILNRLQRGAAEKSGSAWISRAAPPFWLA